MKKEETLYEVIITIDWENTTKIITSEFKVAAEKYKETIAIAKKIASKGEYFTSAEFWKYDFLKETKCEMVAYFEGGKRPVEQF